MVPVIHLVPRQGKSLSKILGCSAIKAKKSKMGDGERIEEEEDKNRSCCSPSKDHTY